MYSSEVKISGAKISQLHAVKSHARESVAAVAERARWVEGGSVSCCTALGLFLGVFFLLRICTKCDILIF